MLKTSVIGNLGKDAEVRVLEGGRSVINFSVCHTESYTKKGETQKTVKSVWVECSIWKNNDQSTAVAQYLKKGGKVYVEGEISADAYVNQQGGATGKLILNVKHLELLGGSGENNSQAGNTAAAPANNGGNDVNTNQTPKDDLPF